MIPRLEPSSKTEALYLDFLSQLGKVGFGGEIQIDHGDRCVQGTDNSIYQMMPQGAVYPRSTDDLIILCELLSQKQYHEVVLAPRGGGTGTNGQSLTDGIVVDLSRHMNSILEINAEKGWVRVQSGVVKDQLNTALKAHGLFFAPELSTSNRATIGGMINTDASGQGSCVYGKTRDHVLELQTVLLDGSVLHSQALENEEFISLAEQQNKSGLIHRVIDSINKENRELIEATFPKLNRCLTGYDLAHIRDEQGRFNLNNILCGSEGTLGFIAEAKLNVLPIPKATALIVVKYGDFEASLRDATELMRAGPTSIETIDSKVLSLAMKDFIWSQVEEFFEDETPVAVKGINFAEYTADSEEELTEKMQPLLSELQASEFNADSRRIGFSVALGRKSVNKIWAMRKRAVGLLGNGDGEERPVPFVEDTAVPPEHLADFIMEFREILDGYELQYGMFGHVDAGVLHVRPALDMKDPDQETMAWEISDRVADLCHQYHGLLWGEHGKGVRSDYSPKFFGELYPQLQRVKAVFDPNNQLNPGKIATPSDKNALFKINEVPTRGQSDRTIAVSSWNSFEEAVYCNGNGACYNWNPNDAMCPSWKATRKRTHSPKGRASLIREWLRLLSENDAVIGKKAKSNNVFTALVKLPKKIGNSRRAKKGELDFSHEVYESMSACLACKSCTGQCPIKVDVPEFRSKFLSHYHSRYLRPLKDHLVANLENLLPLVAYVPWLYNPIMSNGLVRWFLRTGVGFVDAPLLSYAKLASAGIEIANPKQLSELSEDEKSRTVVIVQDAFTRYFETPLIIDLFQFLRALGFKPLLAPFKPNGKPLHVHGFLDRFSKVAEKNSRMLSRIENTGVALIGVDPSMTLTYRSEYSKHLSESETLPKVQLLQEWLSQKTALLSNAKPDHKKSFTLALHCTEKTNATASNKQWLTIFEALGQELKIIDLGCCGMAGTFGHEAANREISKDLYNMSWRDPVASYTETDDGLLATGYSCRSQAKREAGEVLLHPIQALLKCFEGTTATQS